MLRTLTLCALLIAAPVSLAQDAGRDMVEIKLARDLKITDLLDLVGKLTKRPLLYDPNSQRIRGASIGVDYAVKVPTDRVFDKFRSILAFYELILVPVGPKGHQTYLVVDSRSTNNIIKNKAVFVPIEKLAEYEDRDGMYISTTIPIQHLTNLTVLRTALSTMVSPAGLGRVHEAQDKLIITDFAPSVVAMSKIVRELDKPQPEVVRKMELVRLQHAPANEVADVLKQLIPAPKEAPANARRSIPSRSKPPTRIAAYPRLNAIAIYADGATRKEIKEMIVGLDVPTPK